MVAKFMDTLRPPHRVALSQQNPLYPQRHEVSDLQVAWHFDHPGYAPVYYARLAGGRGRPLGQATCGLPRCCDAAPGASVAAAAPAPRRPGSSAQARGGLEWPPHAAPTIMNACGPSRGTHRRHRRCRRPPRGRP